MVYVSGFSPGAVCALERKTGELVWRRELPSLGASAVHIAQEKLSAKTANTLSVLEPEAGKTIWSFCPYGESGESIYSAPTIHRNNVFIGDRRGYLHCLDSRTGEIRWKQRISKAENCDLNSTPVVVQELVLVGTNARMTAAYDTKTGKREWIRKLDGPSVFGPLVYRGLVVAVTASIYLLKPESGKVVRRFSWEAGGINAILRGNWPPGGNVKLVGLDESGIQFTETCRAFVPFLHYAAEGRLIYVSDLEGIDIRRSESGLLACKIQRKNHQAGNGPVDVKRSTIYVLTADGYVYALRHPAV
jgi:hypothetical protein